MKRFELHFDGDQAEFRPFESLKGSVTWHFDEEPKSVEINLCWFTEGKGERDSLIVDSLRVDNPERTGSRSFEFELPEAPYSFSGSLISLIWLVEALARPSEDVAQRQFVLSPTGREIVLQNVQSAAER